MPRFTLAKVEALGHALKGVEALAIDLPGELGADGLLGNNSLSASTSRSACGEASCA